MSFSWTTNTTPASGSIAMYSFWAKLIAQGWTKPKDSDGTTYSATGAQVTSGAAGANGLGNTKAWGVLVSPAGISGGSFCFQRDTPGYQWRIKYSISAGFSGGAPSATQVPSAADEFVFVGSGTDAAPVMMQFLPSNEGSYRFSCGADGASPYGFWAASFPVGGGAASFGFVFDPLTNTIPGDTHKYLLYFCGGNAFKISGLSNEALAPSTGPQMAATVASATPSLWTGIPAMLVYSNAGSVTFPNGMAVDPITGNDPMHAIEIMRRAAVANPGQKGVLSLMKWTGILRTVGDTLTVATTRDRIILGDVSIPWDGSVVVV